MSQSDSTRPEVLPWEDRHCFAEESVNKLGGRIHHCFRSAFNHLRRSWILHPIDSEMSLFRAITAEEEAATALFLALRQRKYKGADNLKLMNHLHKSAVSPFLDAVANLLVETKFPLPKLKIYRGSRPAIHLVIDIGALTGDEEPLLGKPDHPFNYLLRVGDDVNAYRFEKQLQALADSSGSQSMLKMIEREANLRNRILYAGDNGIPSVQFNDNLILRRRDRVYRLALITIGILQTTDHQLFVQQCLDSFWVALGKVVEENVDHQDVFDPEGLRLTVIQQSDGRYDLGVVFKTSVDAEISGVWLIPMRVSDIKLNGMNYIEY